MVIETIVWVVLAVALAVGLYYGIRANRVRNDLANRGLIPRWQRSTKITFSDPNLARLSLRAGAAGVVAAICLFYLFGTGRL